MAENTAPTQLRDPRRSAVTWLARQLAWEKTLGELRSRSGHPTARAAATGTAVAAQSAAA